MCRGQREKPTSRETEMQEKQPLRMSTGASLSLPGSTPGCMLPEPTVGLLASTQAPQEEGELQSVAGCAGCLRSGLPSEELSSVK